MKEAYFIPGWFELQHILGKTKNLLMDDSKAILKECTGILPGFPELLFVNKNISYCIFLLLFTFSVIVLKSNIMLQKSSNADCSEGKLPFVLSMVYSNILKEI